ncbi:MAG: squalene/phytoene synthase family protein [Chloroflexi bacterium]|nr:squalene/phytoene synthase family protein [Chloroflexota bacterium]
MTSVVSKSASGNLACQSALLKEISRTFALTIPQLPDGLRDVVTNAYLLCRIADTIEDEPNLSLESKAEFLDRFVEVVAGREDAACFGRNLGAVLSSSTKDSEHDLVANADRVITVTRGLRDRQRAAVERCLRIMARGMAEFQQSSGAAGLDDLPHLNRYCYHVAGVVAEMLVEFFCDYSPEIDARREEALKLSVSYGRGLQMTNIINDIWDDLRVGVCWLPRDVFFEAGFDLALLEPWRRDDPGFVRGLRRLVAVTHHQLAEGLRFILLIPARESGIRRHLLWTLGLAVLTLRGVYNSAGSGEEVAVPGYRIRAMTLLMSALSRSNAALGLVFNFATRGLSRDDGRETGTV